MKKEKITVALLAVLFFGICTAVWIHPASEYSESERRALEQFPSMTPDGIADGKFMEEFESYTLDQFPFRDTFRSLKALVSGQVFRKADNNEIYVYDGYAVKMEYPLHEESLENAGSKFEKLYETYLETSKCQIYAAVVPDKNFFLGEKSGHLTMDYDRCFQLMEEEMPYAKRISLEETLEIEDYYQTDIHWRQEQLVDTAKKIGQAMGINLQDTYEMQTLEKGFYGVYFGQSALNLPGERLHYLTNATLEQCTVYNYETGKTTGIYDMPKAEGKDPYELFLSGSVSLLKIENPSAETDKELIIFRDSFGSSLAPLLAEGYRSITLVDIRYIQSDLLGKFIEFDDQDVLFLYSTSILNHSETLK